MAAQLRREVVWEFDAQTSGMVAGLRSAGKALDSLRDDANGADAALRDIGDVTIDVDKQSLETAKRQLDSISDVRVGLEFDKKTLGALRARLEAEKRELQSAIGNVDADIDATKALAELQNIERKIKSIDRMNAKVDLDIDKDAVDRIGQAADGIADLGTSGFNLAKSLEWFTKTPGTAGVVAGVGTALLTVAGAAATLAGPGAMGALGAAIGGGGAGGLLYLYDKWAKGNTRIGDAFKELRKEAKETAKSVVGVTGKIMEDIVMDLDVDKAISGAFKGIRSWVKDNQAQLEQFFIAVGKATTAGIKLISTFAEVALPGLGDAIMRLMTGMGRSVSSMLRMAAAGTEATGTMLEAIGNVTRVLPGMRDIGDAFVNAGQKMKNSASGLRQYADDNDRFIDSVSEAWRTFKSSVLPAITSGLDDAGKQVDKWWKELDKRGKDQTLALRVAIERGSKDEVEATLDTLSKKRLAEIVSKTDRNSDDKSERTLNKLARKRLAELRAETRNDDNVNKRLNNIADTRTAKFGAEAGDSVGRMMDRLNDIANKDRRAKFGAEAGESVGNVAARLNDVAKNRDTTINVKTTGANLANEIGQWAGRTFTTTVKVFRNVQTSGSGTARTFSVSGTGRSGGSSSSGTATGSVATFGASSSARHTPTIINVEVDGYRVARQVQRRFTASGRVYV